MASQSDSGSFNGGHDSTIPQTLAEFLAKEWANAGHLAKTLVTRGVNFLREKKIETVDQLLDSKDARAGFSDDRHTLRKFRLKEQYMAALAAKLKELNSIKENEMHYADALADVDFHPCISIASYVSSYTTTPENFSNIRAAHLDAMKRRQKVIDSEGNQLLQTEVLTPHQAWSLALYTQSSKTSFHQHFHDVLDHREQHSAQFAALTPYIQLLTSAYKRLPSKKGTVFRGTTITTTQIESYLIGETKHMTNLRGGTTDFDKAITFARNRTAKKTGDWHCVVIELQDVTFYDIHKYSMFEDESEVMIGLDSDWEVKDVINETDEENNDYTRIVMTLKESREVTPKNPGFPKVFLSPAVWRDPLVYASPKNVFQIIRKSKSVIGIIREYIAEVVHRSQPDEDYCTNLKVEREDYQSATVEFFNLQLTPWVVGDNGELYYPQGDELEDDFHSDGAAAQALLSAFVKAMTDIHILYQQFFSLAVSETHPDVTEEERARVLIELILYEGATDLLGIKKLLVSDDDNGEPKITEEKLKALGYEPDVVAFIRSLRIIPDRILRVLGVPRERVITKPLNTVAIAAARCSAAVITGNMIFGGSCALATLSSVDGIISGGITLVAVAFHLYQYWRGDISLANCMYSCTESIAMSGAAIGGMVAGAKLGAVIGACWGPAAPIAVPVLAFLFAVFGAAVCAYIVKKVSKRTKTWAMKRFNLAEEPLQRRKTYHSAVRFLGLEAQASYKKQIQDAIDRGLDQCNPKMLTDKATQKEFEEATLQHAKYVTVQDIIHTYWDALNDAMVTFGLRDPADETIEPLNVKHDEVQNEWRVHEQRLRDKKRQAKQLQDRSARETALKAWQIERRRLRTAHFTLLQQTTKKYWNHPKLYKWIVGGKDLQFTEARPDKYEDVDDDDDPLPKVVGFDMPGSNSEATSPGGSFTSPADNYSESTDC